ncbi:MAG: YIP1 family protein [Candidatus Aenigmarchaeota archaeon]|nr:YIP1 family protein [Candidatus Aenigmarchaeota archaeon]MDI6722636.1 YIP1 family protein [Candidatus Aenigmarchaeota archaeon]
MKLLIDSPNGFFKRSKEDFLEAVIYMMLITAVFIVFNEASIRIGLTKYVPRVGIIESIIINYFALVTGFFQLVFVFSLLFARKFGLIKSYVKSFFVLAYAGTPIFLIGWIPFGIMKGIALIWAMFFLVIGINIKMNCTYKKSLLAALFIIAIVYAMIVLSRNEILSIVPIYR